MFLIVVLSTGIALTATTSSQLNNIRKVVHENLTTPDKLKEVYLNKTYGSENTVKAYKGLCRVMMAETTVWPTTKWQYFSEGRDMIEEAIKIESGNIELRYIRLLVQLNAPAMLGYQGNIDADVSKFAEGLPTSGMSEYWKNVFVVNLLNCKYITSEHKQSIEALNQVIGKSE